MNYYKPNKYKYKFYGTKILYEYNTYKVLEQKEERKDGRK